MHGTPAHHTTDVLALVLQRVPQRGRLQSCALTCRSWRAAANQATAHVDCSAEPEMQLQTAHRVARCLPGWLSRNASYICSLHLDLGCSNDWQVQLQLPLQQLRQLQHLHLQFNSCTIYTSSSNASGGSSSSNPLAALAGSLTTLELLHCTLEGPGGGLAVITMLTALKRLQLVGTATQHAAAAVGDTPSGEGTRPAAATSLGQMTWLTDLSLAHSLVNEVRNVQGVWSSRSVTSSAVAVEAISSLTALQQLELAVDLCPGLPQLPASLQQLHIHSQPDCHLGCPPNSTLQLTNLRQLELRGVRGVDPAAINGMSQLQHLVIDLPEVDYITALLPVLASCTQLQHLDLNYSDPVPAGLGGFDGAEEEAASEEPELDERACAALTASTQLTHLAVRGYLPADAGRHMFPEGRQLPQLHTLCMDYDGSPECVFDERESFPRFISACPALRSMRLARIVSQGAGLEELLHVSTLRALCFWRVSNTEVMQSVAEMTQLQELTLLGATFLSDAGALQLTALTGLTRLTIQGSSSMTVGLVPGQDDVEGSMDCCQGAWWDLAREVDIQLTSQSAAPDVWLQLHQLLVQRSRDGDCLRPLMDEQQQARARQQQQQLQQAQQQLQQAHARQQQLLQQAQLRLQQAHAQQQQQLRQAQQQLQQAQDTIAQLQAQLAGQQQHNSM